MNILEFSQNLTVLLPLIYIIPTYVIYFTILFTIFASKVKNKFSGTFYHLFGISVIVYFLYSLTYYISMRMPNAPIFIPFVKLWGKNKIVLTFLQTSVWYFSHVVHLFNVLLCFNRFTVFALKVSYQHFWKKWTKVFVAFCFLFPFTLVWHIPFANVYMQLKNESNPESLRYLAEGSPENISWMSNPRNSSILITVTTGMSLLFNFYVIIKLLQERFGLENRTKSIGKISPQDIKFCIYTMLIFATDSLNCGTKYAFMLITNEAFINLIFDVHFYLSDITALAPAWFILATNRNLRKQICIYIFRVDFQSSVATVVPLHSRRLSLA